MQSTAITNLTARQAVSVVGSIFRVRRDLVSLVKDHVIGGTGLTLEQADVLIDIYGAAELGWPDPRPIAKGSKWVTLASLQKSVVNNAPELVSRRIVDLKSKRFVNAPAFLTKEEASALGVSAKSKKVCLTEAGKAKAEEILKKYGDVCLQLLNRLPPDNLEDAIRVKAFNEKLMDALRFRI